MATATRLKLTPRAILALGWLGFMLYAYPGYMSFDSTFQLRQSRTGVMYEGHPPVMAELWRVVELFIAGPLGMLLIQSVCFLAGTYLLLRRWMSERAAAIVASAILWFPVTAATMAVIWKDSQMAAYLMLGIALLLDERRKMRVLGLAALWMATAMRHNAFAMTLPLIVLLFYWSPAQRWWKRYSLAFVAWFAITASVQVLNKSLVITNAHLWHEGMALFDITSTMRFLPPMPDVEVEELLDGAQLGIDRDLHAFTQQPVTEWNFAFEMWQVTNKFFKVPRTQAERDAVARAWKRVVAANPIAYLTYRWHLFRQILQLVEVPEELRSSAIYYWYVDVQQPEKSAEWIEHDASAGTIQGTLRELMWWFGTTPLFRTYVYVLLSLLAIPLIIRDRGLMAIALSGLIGEAALFILAPITDWRYSFWLVVASLVVVAAAVARRANGTHAKPTTIEASMA